MDLKATAPKIIARPHLWVRVCPAAAERCSKAKNAWTAGCDRVTVQNLEVVRVDTDRSILLVKGGIPGAKGSLVMVKTAVKSSK